MDEEPDLPFSLWERCADLRWAVHKALPYLPRAFHSPCSDGTIFLSWTVSPTREALIEVGERDFKWSMRDSSGAFETGPCADFAGAVAEVRRIAATA